MKLKDTTLGIFLPNTSVNLVEAVGEIHLQDPLA
jgi:hypothetical protein